MLSNRTWHPSQLERALYLLYFTNLTKKEEEETKLLVDPGLLIKTFR